MDFAKLVDVFDRHGVTFVSVTQSFNTTTSMGRLTLNILLSFPCWCQPRRGSDALAPQIEEFPVTLTLHFLPALRIECCRRSGWVHFGCILSAVLLESKWIAKTDALSRYDDGVPVSYTGGSCGGSQGGCKGYQGHDCSQYDP
jgi:hypothetical protein